MRSVDIFDSYRRRHLISGFNYRCKIRFAHVLSRSPPRVSLLRKLLSEKVRTIAGKLSDSRWERGQQIPSLATTSQVMLAMTIGEGDLLPKYLKETFRELGLAHLLVVSGYHLSIFVFTLYFVVRLVTPKVFLCLYPKTCGLLGSFFSLIVCLFYISLCGMGTPLFRAGMAFSIGILIHLFGRKLRLWQVYHCCLFFLLAYSPYAFLDLGVQLTFGALAGISYALTRGTRNESIWVKYFRVQFYATTMTTAIVFLWLGKLYLAGFLLNPFFGPIFGIVGTQMGCVMLGLLFIPGSDYVFSCYLSLLRELLRLIL